MVSETSGLDQPSSIPREAADPKSSDGNFSISSHHNPSSTAKALSLNIDSDSPYVLPSSQTFTTPSSDSEFGNIKPSASAKQPSTTSKERPRKRKLGLQRPRRPVPKGPLPVSSEPPLPQESESSGIAMSVALSDTQLQPSTPVIDLD